MQLPNGRLIDMSTEEFHEWLEANAHSEQDNAAVQRMINLELAAQSCEGNFSEMRGWPRESQPGSLSHG